MEKSRIKYWNKNTWVYSSILRVNRTNTIKKNIYNNRQACRTRGPPGGGPKVPVQTGSRTRGLLGECARGATAGRRDRYRGRPEDAGRERTWSTVPPPRWCPGRGVFFFRGVFGGAINLTVHRRRKLSHGRRGGVLATFSAPVVGVFRNDSKTTIHRGNGCTYAEQRRRAFGVPCTGKRS